MSGTAGLCRWLDLMRPPGDLKYPLAPQFVKTRRNREEDLLVVLDAVMAGRMSQKEASDAMVLQGHMQFRLKQKMCEEVDRRRQGLQPRKDTIRTLTGLLQEYEARFDTWDIMCPEEEGVETLDFTPQEPPSPLVPPHPDVFDQLFAPPGYPGCYNRAALVDQLRLRVNIPMSVPLELLRQTAIAIYKSATDAGSLQRLQEGQPGRSRRQWLAGVHVAHQGGPADFANPECVQARLNGTPLQDSCEPKVSARHKVVMTIAKGARTKELTKELPYGGGQTLRSFIVAMTRAGSGAVIEEGLVG
ncbi:hypothetical protein WJX72_001912 [[Myrmecia] bisecta]|uniref:Uncharacterized protein n=1 Tax=[Myrmecia] bisecta TaxID=41462 RepID=A0AAW1PN20_9CHLO